MTIYLYSPELICILLWMFSFDSTFLSQLCVDILKSCRADKREKGTIFLNSASELQVGNIKVCVLVYSPGLGLVGLWENCWAENRNMTSSEETDKRELWSEKSRRSKPVRGKSLFVLSRSPVSLLYSTFLSPFYLALFWQTVAVVAGVEIQHQTSPPLLLYTATHTTEQTQIRNHEGNINKCDWILGSTLDVSWLWPTLQGLLSCALYSRWASTILSTMYFCSRVKLADKAWSRQKLTQHKVKPVSGL